MPSYIRTSSVARFQVVTAPHFLQFFSTVRLSSIDVQSSNAALNAGSSVFSEPSARFGGFGSFIMVVALHKRGSSVQRILIARTSYPVSSSVHSRIFVG